MATVQYTVKPGDSLWKIAMEFDTTVNDIARYNGIVNPDDIAVGQVLRIYIPEQPSTEIPEWYIVREGDTLYTIAKKFNTTVDQLVELNNLCNPDVSSGLCYWGARHWFSCVRSITLFHRIHGLYKLIIELRIKRVCVS